MLEKPNLSPGWMFKEHSVDLTNTYNPWNVCPRCPRFNWEHITPYQCDQGYKGDDDERTFP